MENLITKESIEGYLSESFLVPRLTVDIPLYRYRSNIDYAVDEIKNNHVYLSPISTLNDPFDSSAVLTYQESSQIIFPLSWFCQKCSFLSVFSWYSEVSLELLEGPDEIITLKQFADIIEKKSKTYLPHCTSDFVIRIFYKRGSAPILKRRVLGRVACFSEVMNSIPMWSYYANSHKGVCFKYDFPALSISDDYGSGVLSIINKVWYSSIRHEDPNGMFSPFFKSLEWAHEGEWRIFSPTGENYVFLPCLSEIYIGLNAEWESIEKIVNAVKETERNIAIYMLSPLPNEYDFKKTRLII